MSEGFNRRTTFDAGDSLGKISRNIRHRRVNEVKRAEQEALLEELCEDSEFKALLMNLGK